MTGDMKTPNSKRRTALVTRWWSGRWRVRFLLIGTLGIVANGATPARQRNPTHVAQSGETKSLHRIQPFFQRGIAFTQERWRNGGGYASPQIGAALAPLKRLGVNAISVSPFAFMPGPSSPELIRFRGESDDGVVNAISQARGLGLKVMLKPQIWLRGGFYSGNIHFDNAQDRARWFANYQEWILHYALLAEQNHADLFCVGNELGEMVQDEHEWRELIAAVRRIYHGPITYAAHWGGEFETLEFWDELDYIGLNNYYPLTNYPLSQSTEREGSKPDSALQKAAEEVVHRVEAVQQRFGRPLIFTEAGFPSRRGGLREPWNDRGTAVADMQEQARGYEAVFRAFYAKPWFYGMYWWKWYSTGEGGGPDDASMTPMNKPAAAVMSQWYLSPQRKRQE